MRTSSIAIAIICLVGMIVVAVPVVPHFMRVVSQQHHFVILTQQQRKKHRKIQAVTPAELQRVIRHCNKDTVLIHFWHTWSDDGTQSWSTLKKFARGEHSSVAILHVCTDMTGIQQMKASAVIAEELALEGPLYGIRSKASLFDLHNHDAAGQFYKSLTGSFTSRVSPSVLALNRHGKTMRIDGIDNTETNIGSAHSVYR